MILRELLFSRYQTGFCVLSVCGQLRRLPDILGRRDLEIQAVFCSHEAEVQVCESRAGGGQAVRS